MRKTRFNFRKWTLTIMSNKITAPVRHFTISRVVLIFFIVLIFIPVGLLYYYSSLNEQLLLEKTSLHQEVNSLKTMNSQLSTDIEGLIDERERVLDRYSELDEIEDAIHQYMNELPEEALGGIEIPLDDEEAFDSYASSSDELLLSTNWIERYHDTINSIETLEHNLLYIPTHWPTEPNIITSGFGPRNDPFNRSPSIHSGIDVRGAIGTPIYAAADGRVQLAQYYGGYGNTIILNHGDRFETLYAHLSKIEISPGEKVMKGDKIGELGSSGRSTAPHLHYEVIKDGNPVDPELYLDFFNNGIN